MRKVLQAVALLGTLFLAGCLLTDHELFDVSKGVPVELANKDLECVGGDPTKTPRTNTRYGLRKIEGEVANLYDIAEIVGSSDSSRVENHSRTAFFPIDGANNIYVGADIVTSGRGKQFLTFWRIESTRIDFLLLSKQALGTAGRMNVPIVEHKSGESFSRNLGMESTPENQRAFLAQIAKNKELDTFISCRVR